MGGRYTSTRLYPEERTCRPRRIPRPRLPLPPRRSGSTSSTRSTRCRSARLSPWTAPRRLGLPPPARRTPPPGCSAPTASSACSARAAWGSSTRRSSSSPRRRVALKVIRGGRFVDERHVRMFRREIETLARLNHPNIGAIYDAGSTEEGQHFFAMELVRGRHARRLCSAPAPRPARRGGARASACALFLLDLRRGPLRPPARRHPPRPQAVEHRRRRSRRADAFRRTAHGDAAPSPPVKILDFGLARITDADVDSRDAGDRGRHASRGTLPYMSPEQARGNPDAIDVRSDVYALGRDPLRGSDRGAAVRHGRARRFSTRSGSSASSLRRRCAGPGSGRRGTGRRPRDDRRQGAREGARPALRQRRGARRGRPALPRVAAHPRAGAEHGLPAAQVRAPQPRPRGRASPPRSWPSSSASRPPPRSPSARPRRGAPPRPHDTTSRKWPTSSAACSRASTPAGWGPRSAATCVPASRRAASGAGRRTRRSPRRLGGLDEALAGGQPHRHRARPHRRERPRARHRHRAERASPASPWCSRGSPFDRRDVHEARPLRPRRGAAPCGPHDLRERHSAPDACDDPRRRARPRHPLSPAGPHRRGRAAAPGGAREPSPDAGAPTTTGSSRRWIRSPCSTATPTGSRRPRRSSPGGLALQRDRHGDEDPFTLALHEQPRAGAEERGQAPRRRASGGRDARRPPPGARQRRPRDDESGQQPGDPLPPDGALDKAEAALPRGLRNQPPSARRRAPGSPVTMTNLGRLYMAQEKYGEAEALLSRAVATSRRVQPPGFFGTGFTLQALGDALVGLGRYPEAETALLEARHPRAGARCRLRQPHPRDGVAGEALRAHWQRDTSRRVARETARKELTGPRPPGRCPRPCYGAISAFGRLGEHPFVSRLDLDPGSVDFCSRVTVEHQEPPRRARMLYRRCGERPSSRARVAADDRSTHTWISSSPPARWRARKSTSSPSAVLT